MTRRGRLRRRIRRDDGAMLVFAMIIITVVAVVVGAILTRGGGSLKATVTLRSVAGSSYAADAAANVAINDLRTGYGFSTNPNESGFDNSLDGAGCFGNNVGSGGTDTLSLPGFYPATGTLGTSSAYVECAGEAGTGQQGSPVIINNSNKPGYAIITLNGNLTASQPLKVHGGIWVNGNISGNVSLDAGDVHATGTCANTTVSGTATKQCGPSNPAAAIADPNDCSIPAQAATCHGYDSDVTTLPALQTPPTSCTSGVAVFTPGYYDNAATMNTASALCNTLWFKPGAYYFDFRNNTCTTYCPTTLFGDQSSNDVWTIPRGTSLVGGTPINAAGAVISMPTTNPTMPGSCQSPITNQSAVGVQFVFGNDSRLFLAGNGSSGAHMELCASYHSDRPPIELLGLKSGGTLSSTNDNGRDISNGGSVVSAGSFTGATVANLKSGGSGASWTTASASAQTSTLTINGFAPSTTVPAGSVLLSAVLHIKHLDGDTANAKPTATLKAGSTTTSVQNLTASATSTTQNITFSGTDLTSLQQEVHDHGYTGATVSYSVSAKKNNATSNVGPITLDLTYSVPVLRGETGTCVATGTSCSLVSLDPSGNNKIFMYLQGTTYAPLADLNIVLSNFSAEVAKFGVIARQLEFNVNTGNPSWTGPVFEIPDNSPGYGYSSTIVDLKVHVCLGSATVTAACQANTPALTSRVQVWDPSGTPAPPGRQMTILSWSRSS